MKKHTLAAAMAAVFTCSGGASAGTIDDDLLQRARQPMIEAFDNALKSNNGWMGLTDRAQSEPDQIDRFLQSKERLLALGPQDIRIVAERYLLPGGAVEVLVLPEETGTQEER